MLPVPLLVLFASFLSPALAVKPPHSKSLNHLLFSPAQNNRIATSSQKLLWSSSDDSEEPECDTDPEQQDYSSAHLNETLLAGPSLHRRVTTSGDDSVRNSKGTPTFGNSTTPIKVVANPKYVLNPKNPSFATASLTLPAPPSTTCATQYTNTAGGAVYGPGLGTFPMSPRPSTFVTRSGASLMLDGEVYRMVGPNIYWLGLDENVDPSPSYPDKGRVREAMAITVAMGGNTIRSHTLGVSTGNSLSVWPSAYNTNAAAFDAIDYAIFAARNYGLRLIIPLTDNYAYYHGGKYDFIGWAGEDTNNGNLFYTKSDIITIYKDYISVVLNHVNTYTGVALGADPTILAWETGNELGGYFLGGGAPPASWTKVIAQHIKALAPNHLVIDGADGLVNSAGTLLNTGFSVSYVDMISDHFYPAMDWLLTKDQGLMDSNTVKNFFVGELDWTNQFGGDSLSDFYSILESIEGSGSMMWSLFGHDGECCLFVEHPDGYSLMYPNGNTAALQAQAKLVMQHWYRMRGLTAPSTLAAVACPQPPLLP